MRLSWLLLITALIYLPGTLLAQDDHVQPRVEVRLPDAGGTDANVVALTERINGDLLHRLNRHNRFELSIEDAPEDLESFAEELKKKPPEEIDVVVSGVLDQRRDGSYRYLFDIWSQKLKRVTYSQEFDARGIEIPFPHRTIVQKKVK